MLGVHVRGTVVSLYLSPDTLFPYMTNGGLSYIIVIYLKLLEEELWKVA